MLDLTPFPPNFLPLSASRVFEVSSLVISLWKSDQYTCQHMNRGGYLFDSKVIPILSSSSRRSSEWEDICAARIGHSHMGYILRSVEDVMNEMIVHMVVPRARS